MTDGGEDFLRSAEEDRQTADTQQEWDGFPAFAPSETTDEALEEDETPDTSTAQEPSAASDNRLSTGIPQLDRAMDGGVPPGRLVALVTEPGVQSRLLLQRLLAQRQTLYIATDRPEWEVRHNLDPGVGQGDVVIKAIPPEALLESQAEVLAELGPESNLILDAINELELVPRQHYRTFLSTIKRVLYETGSMGLLYGVSVDQESARDMTLRRADIVWRLKTIIEDTEIETRLFLPKFHGGAASPNAVKLLLTDEVEVDTSRDIA